MPGLSTGPCPAGQSRRYAANSDADAGDADHRGSLATEGGLEAPVGPGRIHSERSVWTRVGANRKPIQRPVTQPADVGHVVDTGHDRAEHEVDQDQRRRAAT